MKKIDELELGDYVALDWTDFYVDEDDLEKTITKLEKVNITNISDICANV